MKKINYGKFIKYLAVVILLVLLYSLGLLGPLENVLNKGLNPLLSAVQKISSSIRIKYEEQVSKADFTEILEKKQSEIDALLAENAQLKVAKDENETLRKYLNYFKKSSQKRVLASVISRGDMGDQAGRVETMVIDKGKNDGLQSDMVVINEEGAVIGKVSEVKDSISEIEVILNDDCKLAATVLGDDSTSGIIQGDLGLTMNMDFIPQSKALKENDIVVTSGLEKFIPRGLVIGKIAKLTKENNDLWQKAVVESSIDFDKVITVAVILP